RVNFVVTADADGARAFLGPLTEQFLVYCDPDRAFVRTLGLSQLPAFAFVRLDGTLQACAEGWNAAEWREVAEQIATATAWISPTIPVAGAPGPFHGTPAFGGDVVLPAAARDLPVVDVLAELGTALEHHGSAL